jgi:hypothetical protein
VCQRPNFVGIIFVCRDGRDPACDAGEFTPTHGFEPRGLALSVIERSDSSTEAILVKTTTNGDDLRHDQIEEAIKSRTKSTQFSPRVSRI